MLRRRNSPVKPEGTGSTSAAVARAGGSGRGSAGLPRAKQEAVLRMLRGEPMDSLSRELGVEIYRLEQWRDRALAAMQAGLKSRRGDPLQAELDAAMKRLGQLAMENELLQVRCRKGNIPFPKGRSRR